MAITLDNFGFGTNVGASATVNHTVNSNTNGIILAFFSSLQGNSLAASPTFNGTNMSLILSGTKISNVTLTAYYFLNPPTGVGTIIGTTSPSGTPSCTLTVSYTGVSQSTPIAGSLSGSQNFAAPGTLLDAGFTAGNIFVGANYDITSPGTLQNGTQVGTAMVTTHEYLLAHDNVGSLIWKTTGNTDPLIGVELTAAGAAVPTVNKTFKSLLGVGNI